jgi:hypothetical protein
MTPNDRKRIAHALNVTHKTIGKDLSGFVPEVQTTRPQGRTAQGQRKLERRRQEVVASSRRAKGGTSMEPDLLGRVLPPDEWRQAIYAAIPRLVAAIELWDDLRVAREHHYRLIDVHPWLMLRIHRCAACQGQGRRYVAHHTVKRCEACERKHRKAVARRWNAGMVERRSEARAAARAAMTCAEYGSPMTGGRLRRYCSPACRQAAFRARS